MGRAQYLAGQLPEARQSLERAVAQHNDDYLARLYLGLTLARSGDGSVGLKDIESGMKGIYDQLEWIVTRTTTLVNSGTCTERSARRFKVISP